MAYEYEKAMGPIWSPMASLFPIGIRFMGDPCQNRNKRNKRQKYYSCFSLLWKYKTYYFSIVKKNLISLPFDSILGDGMENNVQRYPTVNFFN